MNEPDRIWDDEDDLPISDECDSIEHDCLDCAGGKTKHSFGMGRFVYTRQFSIVQVWLPARLHMWTCQVCGAQTTDGRSEDAKQAAINEYERKLAAGEVPDPFALTMQQFAAEIRRLRERVLCDITDEPTDLIPTQHYLMALAALDTAYCQIKLAIAHDKSGGATGG